MLAHNVFFSLHDSSETKRAALVAACKKYLADHPGVVFFACGGLQAGLERPVNDLNFDVALHVVFDSLASHDLYQVAPEHLQFISENRENWRQVRVFDSDVTSA